MSNSEPDDKPSFPPEQYTIGWISALSEELGAARAMLDQEHERLSHQHRNDEDSYILGNVKQHNIVMPVLPEYGISSATSAVKSMISTFPKLRFILMAGIGGGVPSKKNDVRLGDVVVSEPDGQGGGVIQYDMGRMEIDTFVRLGVMNKPPKLLLSTLRTLRSDPKQGKNLSKILKKALEKCDDLEDCAYPGPEKDILFRPGYRHLGGDDCDACNEDQNVKNIVERKSRKANDPKIHYGNIGSGNMVMKDALVRDSIAEKENVLCFEMEAAGLMNEWPCLVIRGISDYADSHKNGAWKQYAAMTAAAYAKMLLLEVPLEKVEELEQVREVIQVLNSNEDIRVGVNALVDAKHDGDATEILEWLTPVDYAPQHNDLFRKRLPGTGKWFLGLEEFYTWATSKRQTLFCHGIPGAGKTLLTSIVIDHLCQQFGSDPGVGIAYIYFNYRMQNTQPPEELLLSLLKQLAQTRSPLPEPVIELFRKHRAFHTRPTLEATIHTTCDACSKYSETFIVVDALDECHPSNLSWFLDALLKLQEAGGVNILATSRFKPENAPLFRECLLLEIKATDEDILKFLLAKFKTDSLLSQSAKGHLLDTLKALGKGEPALDDAYDEIMDRITSQRQAQKEMAIEALQWIVHSKRPLATLELLHALAVGKGNKSFNLDYIPKLPDLVPLFAGLVEVDEESDIIRLAHQTAQEYFQRKKRYFPGASSVIAKACAQYLSSGVDLQEPFHRPLDIIELLKSNSFYGYAAQNWGHHARESFEEKGTTEKALHKRIMCFLNSGVKVKSSFQFLRWTKVGSVEGCLGVTGLHLATSFGLVDQLRALLHYGYNADQIDDTGMTPLLYAIEEGQTTVVKLFLETARVDVNQRYLFMQDLLGFIDIKSPRLQEIAQACCSMNDLSFRTLLAHAIDSGSLDTVKILLDSHVETGYVYCLPIYFTAFDPRLSRNLAFRSDLMRQLGKSIRGFYDGPTYASTDIEHATRAIRDLRSGSPTWWSLKGNRDIQDALVEFYDLGNDLENKMYHKPAGIRTPLSRAAELGNRDIVKLLLNHGARVELKETGGKDAMTRAKEKGHWDILRLLVESRNR
ncbi:uncharacterized protein NECHADRAFT_74034 [Fusarium vanettenii 77-13-4]|uniref:Nucleoside phosphorylase domain-containing protein n=1 Tax=Fusarium vanettenii (strain ATCC MYA-4622 / CBS 123669 / FGSC 9596 / NRRL 45880 / 77-13-4) TaxID=660122 RepID=C7YVP8_FUSV7|nr:uncharacterized protein NECHADRAFT_74034 [Fusarium vanettenii 77-13-4]EEU44035.1 hypothetical protein NECHADRAFT_74034 [Fusarium vanettenii 77-13-4]